MKVILLHKVPGVGDIDDVVEVAEGYARNFLFPNHFAVQASNQSVHQKEEQAKKKARIAERDLQEQQSLAAKLDGLEVELKEKANEIGLLYAAVGPQKISEVLNKMGFKVERKQILTPQIKSIGEHKVTVKLRHGLESEFTITVSKQ